jgi:hypothetical protein
MNRSHGAHDASFGQPSNDEGAISRGGAVISVWHPLPHEPVEDQRLELDAFQHFPQGGRIRTAPER